MSWGYPRYVPVAEKKAKAAQKLKKLQKKMPGIRPVVIEGKSLARNWWGKSWNKNLERYADYSNRVGRGRSYVRHGAVLDLQIKTGRVTALVQGSAAQPYKVIIKIKAVDPAVWQTIKRQCGGQLKSMQDLLSGQFPKALGDIFFNKDKGLFPSPKAIKFDCSCPDWAAMCKHVAAALYGVGARFDEDPALFFKLRGADTADLIAEAVRDKTGDLLVRSKKTSARAIDDADLSSLFGIEMDNVDFGSVPKRGRKKPKAKKTNPAPPTATSQVAELVISAKAGVNIDYLAAQTGYSRSKLYGIVHRLKQQGKIKNKVQGVYIKA